MKTTHFLCIALAACAGILATPGHARGARGVEAAPEAPAAPEVLLAPFTDHYEMRVEKPVEVVWEHIKRLYVEGERMRQQGFEVSEVVGDPTAWLGGVRGVREGDTTRPQVTILVSAVDDKAHLLSVMIGLENPVPVYVVHQVRPDGAEASIYQTVIQTKWPVRKPEGGELDAAYVAEKMAADIAFHNSEVAEIMQREKAIIEALN
ncbi:hypothetical protein [Sphingopyxis sp. C-1]|uniref:hypothetical protein n=1 Tax=Sphingopyxis sp. C-1 TaxID=262667 RepID=UPI0006BED441|nr:hypothetical protein [Sphingopyxis sp. C-1]GAO80950.1 hypothetical protein SC1_04276 [Sphingopyxis sp. C-1]